MAIAFIPNVVLCNTHFMPGCMEQVKKQLKADAVEWHNPHSCSCQAEYEADITRYYHILARGEDVSWCAAVDLTNPFSQTCAIWYITE